MKHLKKFENWVTTSTWGPYDSDSNVQYVSKDKIYYGVHDIYLSRDDKRVKVKAKFDTGARSSSIDFEVARQLGISDAIIDKCKELENVDIHKNISKIEQKKLEKKFSFNMLNFNTIF